MQLLDEYATLDSDRKTLKAEVAKWAKENPDARDELLAALNVCEGCAFTVGVLAGVFAAGLLAAFFLP